MTRPSLASWNSRHSSSTFHLAYILTRLKQAVPLPDGACLHAQRTWLSHPPNTHSLGPACCWQLLAALQKGLRGGAQEGGQQLLVHPAGRALGLGVSLDGGAGLGEEQQMRGRQRDTGTACQARCRTFLS